MFGEPRLVVLDEPNASLDQAGEAALVDAIGRLKARGATVILVAHRPSLLVDVDKLLVLRDGAGVLFGARDEILPRLMVQRPRRAVTAVERMSERIDRMLVPIRNALVTVRSRADAPCPRPSSRRAPRP